MTKGYKKAVTGVRIPPSPLEFSLCVVGFDSSKGLVKEPSQVVRWQAAKLPPEGYKPIIVIERPRESDSYLI